MSRQMALIPVDHADVDGLEMGIMPDGTPYLSARGLAKLCGVAASTILELSGGWASSGDTKRKQRIQEVLDAQGYDESELYFEIEVRGSRLNAHPDVVCMAMLEYYAFDQRKEEALRNYRILGRAGLRFFIYGRLGYDPLRPTRESFNRHYERMSLNAMPAGYFSVFVESNELAMNVIRAGLVVDSHTVPDISIGKAWAAEWKAGYEDRFGGRKQYPHRYPSDYPQSQAQITAWIYPLASLGEFRLWLQQKYLPEKLPTYIKGKVGSGAISSARAAELVSAMVGIPQLEEDE